VASAAPPPDNGPPHPFLNPERAELAHAGNDEALRGGWHEPSGRPCGTGIGGVFPFCPACPSPASFGNFDAGEGTERWSDEATEGVGKGRRRGRVACLAGKYAVAKDTGRAEAAPAIHITYRPIASLRPGSDQRRCAARDQRPTAGPGGEKRSHKADDGPAEPS